MGQACRPDGEVKVDYLLNDLTEFFKYISYVASSVG